jgi:2',3'-cyclic-nucleotide 2'-phosphodiesterase (5'-nucleotidase family)
LRRFTFDGTAESGHRVIEVSLSDGTPIARDRTTYSLAMADFLTSGGDDYSMFVGGKATTRELMANVVLGYIERLGTIMPSSGGRITNTARAVALQVSLGAVASRAVRRLRYELRSSRATSGQ